MVLNGVPVLHVLVQCICQILTASVHLFARPLTVTAMFSHFIDMSNSELHTYTAACGQFMHTSCIFNAEGSVSSAAHACPLARSSTATHPLRLQFAVHWQCAVIKLPQLPVHEEWLLSSCHDKCKPRLSRRPFHTPCNMTAGLVHVGHSTQCRTRGVDSSPQLQTHE